MMKPLKSRCRKYCDLYDECKRTECNRKLMWGDDGAIKMVEKDGECYSRTRKSEIVRLYKEVCLTKAEKRV